MKKKYFMSLFVFVALALFGSNANGKSDINHESENRLEVGQYTAVIEGYDWGAAVSKVILSLDEKITTVNQSDYTVQVKRSSDCGEIAKESASGERSVVYAYVSDKNGKKVDHGNYVTLVLAVAPNLPIGSPIYYFRSETCSGNKWINYQITVTNNVSGNVWNKEQGRIKPLVDKFDLSGKFTHGNITMSYASFVPESKNNKSPLLIWLHGGGEGGTDPSIALLGNRAANYASDDIQYYFEGAYVLVPQCPTRWMDTGKGRSTSGEENDMYNESLMALIKNYVSANPGIDANRIYLGGCSNGGYESLKLLLLNPNYFAAGFISSLAYSNKNLTDSQISSVKDIPIWFVQSADDKTTLPEETGPPVYKRLIKAGAKNVHMSYYDHVVDITGFYGGDNYHYTGHWSWVYLHANKCKYDFDGTPVKLDGRPVTIMEWLASQKK